MRLFKNTNIDFVGKRKVFFTISLIVILAGIISLVINKGPKYGIDFTGGVSLEIDLSPVSPAAKPITIQEVRDVLAKAGIMDAEIQEIKSITDKTKSYVLVKTKKSTENGENLSKKILEVLKENFPNNVNPATFLRSQQVVGPKIGEELKGKALLAIFWSLLGIILYIWWRFEFTYGLAAIAALFHDVLITVGIFSILGKEITLPIIAALLTIVGYSLNDTIVVFDRIREDLKLYRKSDYATVINKSINQTLSRTIITSLTTFVVVLSLYIFGGSVINDFALALLIGVIVGTYSSIYIASPIMISHFEKRKKRR